MPLKAVSSSQDKNEGPDWKCHCFSCRGWVQAQHVAESDTLSHALRCAAPLRGIRRCCSPRRPGLSSSAELSLSVGAETPPLAPTRRSGCGPAWPAAGLGPGGRVCLGTAIFPEWPVCANTLEVQQKWKQVPWLGCWRRLSSAPPTPPLPLPRVNGNLG